jgi:hypothetical protein
MLKLARRSVMALALVCCASAGGLMAEDAIAPTAPGTEAWLPQMWQDTITTQIEAFRTHDSAGALRMASEAFRSSFPDAETFYRVIVGSGYAPIALSRTHQFGDCRRVDADRVMQDVTLIGADQSLYSARYLLGREADGWRVEAVQLTDEKAIGI